MIYDLLCLTRCHRRVEELEKVLQQFVVDVPAAGVSTFVVIAPDPRSTAAVLTVVDKYRSHLNVLVMQPSVPVMSAEHGQKWIEVLNEMCEAFDRTGKSARWVCDTDDDQVFSAGWEAHFKGCLDDETVWAWRSITLYLWSEDGTQINLKQYHWVPSIGRYQMGARRSTRRVIEIPDFVQDAIDADPTKQKTLPFYLIDYSCVRRHERMRLYRDYARAGKIDPYTERYMAPPLLEVLAEVLLKYPDPAEFEKHQRDLFLKGMCN